jgi:hypothetical protein
MDDDSREEAEGHDGEEKPLRNPFRSEADAFRLLVILIVAIAVMVAAAKLGGPWVGVPVALVVLGLGVRASVLWLKAALQQRESSA